MLTHLKLYIFPYLFIISYVVHLYLFPHCLILFYIYLLILFQVYTFYGTSKTPYSLTLRLVQDSRTFGLHRTDPFQTKRYLPCS